MKIIAFFILTVLFLSQPGMAETKTVLGWVEYIIVEPGGLKLRAKLDTGAKTSSIRANIIKEYEKDGEPWIRYKISDGKKKTIILDSKVERWVRIKKKDATSGFLRRPVVKLGFCIADELVVEEVNLSPRAGFIYPVLIGRNMLKKRVLVDTHRVRTTKPKCREQKEIQ